MSTFRFDLKPIVAAVAATVSFSLPLSAQPAGLEELFERLKTADAVDAARIDREIEMRWSQSGSPSMDLLLKRAREALEAEDYTAAIEHFTALTDHAPEFAEGWHGRAQALLATQRVGPAVADLQRVLVLNPRHYQALFGMGAVFELVGKPEQAYDAYRLVLDLYPHHEEARERLKRLEKGVNGVEL